MTPEEILEKLKAISDDISQLRPHIQATHVIMFGYGIDIPGDVNGGMVLITNSFKGVVNLLEKIGDAATESFEETKQTPKAANNNETE